MKRILYIFSLLLITAIPSCLKAQDTITIHEVRISTSLVRQTLLRTTTAAAIIDSSQLKLQSSTSLIPALNAVAGVRMEERSPGSYRLSLRGSLLRSPFGVRNVKIYLDEYPLTDAGGNTYINALATNAISNIEILKGPDGSLFGANSGGVVSIHTNSKNDKLTAEVSSGSYGLFKQNMAITKNTGNHILNITESYQRADGYRENSKLHRIYLQANDQWHYARNNTVKALVFYSDLYYQTPGGLTKAQYDSAPSQARPATATLPGASQQKAAVYNKMVFAGLTHEAVISKVVENTLAVFASTVDFKNPFITNFEVRKEDTYGARTFFIFSSDQEPAAIKWEYAIGAEWQQTRSDIANYGNDLGTRAALIASGNILSDQHFIFNRLKAAINKKIIAEAGLSLNYYSYRFTDSSLLRNNFKPQWMPRFAVSYSAAEKITLRSSVSRGYSPPTTAEIRPSDNNIYKDLQAETGLNIELGARYSALANRLWLDIAGYNYVLKNAIVRQENNAGAEYFVNAGGTRQKGLELQASYMIISPVQNKRLLKKLEINNSSTLNYFKFRDYISASADYSGKYITGVPKRCFVSSVSMELKAGFYLFVQHNYTAQIPLDDANTLFSRPYNLVQLKLGCPFNLNPGKIELYAGIDNLMNERYSLGNDLNAAGNRFFNAAPLRNYFGGVLVSW